MRVYGTNEGEEIFSETDMDRTFMTRNNTNSRSFKLHHLLHAEQLKAHMRQPRADLVASRENLVQKLENDPFLKRIQSMDKKVLRKIYDQMMALKKQEGEKEAVPSHIGAGFALAGGEELKPKAFKPLLFELFEYGGRCERDKELLRKKKGSDF
jgi:hypothetical protein